MIYTVTLNPSIDFIVRLDRLILKETNRATKDEKYPGGKGIMVSKLLKHLNVETTNLGFIGGFTGAFIKEKLQEIGLKENFIQVPEDTRINIKLKADGETEINTIGPMICKEERMLFLDQIKSLKEGDFIVLSGSLSKGLEKDFYLEIIKILKDRKIEFTLDTTGEVVKKSFSYHPFLIKPNISELQELYHADISSKAEILSYAKKAIRSGCQNVIVSMGSKGAIFTDGVESYFAKPISGKVRNSVGAGDSMVAGFIYAKGKTKEEAFKWAVASATATTFSEDVGTKEQIEKYFKLVEVERITDGN